MLKNVKIPAFVRDFSTDFIDSFDPFYITFCRICTKGRNFVNWLVTERGNFR